MQEGVGGRLDQHPVAVARDREPLQAAHRRLGLALCGAKGAEVMFADERAGRRLHARRIEGAMHPGGPPRVQGRARAAVEDEVAVSARLGAVAGMKVLRHGLRTAQADVGGQFAVGAEQPAAHGAHRLGVEMRDLPARMHAGIRAPGADQGHRGGGDARQGRLGHLLYGRGGGLRLPARVARSRRTQRRPQSGARVLRRARRRWRPNAPSPGATP